MGGKGGGTGGRQGRWWMDGREGRKEEDKVGGKKGGEREEAKIRGMVGRGWWQRTHMTLGLDEHWCEVKF